MGFRAYKMAMCANFLVLLILVLEPLPVHEMSHRIEQILRCTGDPCIVRNNPGGDLNEFVWAADQVRRGYLHYLIIDGACSSGCTVAADELRSYGKVCITQNAVMGFHQAYHSDTGQRFIPPYSVEVSAMVLRAGGFPEPKGINLFGYDNLQRIWPTCGFYSRWTSLDAPRPFDQFPTVWPAPPSVAIHNKTAQ